MMRAVLDAFSERLRRMPGDATLYAKDLSTGETVAWRAETPVVAASVIKLPILAEAFRQARDGLLSLEERYSVRQADKMPSCGALTYLHDGLEVTLRDLCVLMIILSDNTATNLMIDRMGMENVNRSLHAWGLRQTALRRRLFDAQAAARGLQNTVTAGEMGALLERIYHGACVSPDADREMLAILRDQRLNGKIPFFLHDYAIAHKTGEDDGITHDVGIVYAAHPLALCFAGQRTDVPAFERLMQDMSRAFVDSVS